MIRDAIAAVVGGRDLNEAEAASAMEELMTGEATPAQVGALLVALRLKGETVAEIVGMARVMREKSLKVQHPEPLLDTCSTGGGSFDPFNVSTAAAFVCAGAGVAVAKHGNRGFTSASGSADVLEVMGARIELTPEQAATCIKEAGICFLFAQAFHPAMRFVGPARREIGVRTIFNFLGPLTNPAGAQHQLIGVGEARLTEKLAQALAALGTKRSLIVHSEEGLDEVSLSSSTRVHEVRNGEVRTYSLTPEDAGLSRAPLEVFKSGTPQENATRMESIFNGGRGPDRDFVLINAAAGLMAVERVESLKEGVQVAGDAIDSGAAMKALRDYIRVSASFGDKA